MILRLRFVRANQFDCDLLPLAFGFENAAAFRTAKTCSQLEFPSDDLALPLASCFAHLRPSPGDLRTFLERGGAIALDSLGFQGFAGQILVT